MESNKKQPEVRFIGFCDDWTNESLKNLAEINPKTILPDEFKYVDLESVVGIKLSNYRTETKATAPSRAQRLAKKGDIFFQTVRPYQRNNYLFNLSDNDYVFSTGYAQIRPYVDSYFLFSKLQEDKFVSNVIDQCTGTSYPAINSNSLSRIEIYFPNNKEEQKRIGALLENWDIRISYQQQELDMLKQTKQGFLQKMFPKEGEAVPEFRFPGFTEGWGQHKIQWLIDEAIIEKPMDGNHGEKHPTASDYVDYGIPFLMARDIKNGIVDFQNCNFISRERSEKLDKGFAKNGDVLITHKATIGEIAILNGLSSEYAVLTPQVTYYRVADKSKLATKYLYAYFISPEFQSVLKTKSTQSTRSYIGITAQYKLDIKLPKEIKEQEKIGEFFSDLDNLIILRQKELDALKQTKKAFLQKMFV